jgi:[NiFe] hydrogenase assembly HybE family chaperone
MISDKDISELAGKLETVFDSIYRERMSDMPLVNPELQVKAVGFQRWQGDYLGVLTTPWFMNLMLLPGEPEQWADRAELSKQKLAFPSGQYEFITGVDEDMGVYMMCSLFSPMFQFADQQAAIETAEAAINGLMQAEANDDTDAEARNIEQIWHGEIDKDSLSDTQKTSPSDIKRPTLKEKLDKPVSRRELLRGALMMEDEK